MSETILVTGSSGFIGYYVSKRLLEQGIVVIGIDNENDYYDVCLKHDRRKQLQQYANFVFYQGNIEDNNYIKQIFTNHPIEKVCHLAAQVGVRHSINHPSGYIQSNLVGFATVIEQAKHVGVKNFVYASSSSVYGKNTKQPFDKNDPTDYPISLYAATKKANEVIAHSYSHLFHLPTIGLRFFTVYGPWGRPDMAMMKFANNIMKEKPIDIYNHGIMKRDFTYIDDIVDGVQKALNHKTLYDIFNLGNNKPVSLADVISLLEQHLGVSAIKNLLPLQPGDIQETSADIVYTNNMLGRKPQRNIEDGVKHFVKRYTQYYLSD